MSSIAIGIITYPNFPERITELELCIKSVNARVTATRHKLYRFCSCESDDRSDMQAVIKLCAEYSWSFKANQRGPCMGANQNNAMRVAFGELQADYLLLLIDDCTATVDIDLSNEIDVFDADPSIDILRYHWSGRPGARPEVSSRADGYDQIGVTVSRYPYDDSPHLRRSNFVERFGWHVELTPPQAGAVERRTVHSVKKNNASIIATKKVMFSKGGGIVSACRGREG